MNYSEILAKSQLKDSSKKQTIMKNNICLLITIVSVFTFNSYAQKTEVAPKNKTKYVEKDYGNYPSKENVFRLLSKVPRKFQEDWEK